MSNNTILNTGVGGDVIQTIDNASYKTQAVAIVDQTGSNKLNVNPSGAARISSAIDSFRDPFKSFDTTTKWTASIAPSDLTWMDGNVTNAEYLKLSKSAINADTESSFYSKTSFSIPTRVVVGFSLSQRLAGEEHYLEIVGVDDNGVPEVTGSEDTPIGITSLVVTTNVALITLSTNIIGKLNPLDRIVIYGCADSRLNIGSVAITTVYPTENKILVPLTIANGTYTITGGSVLRIDPLGRATNGASYLLEGVTTAYCIPVTRNDGGSPLIAPIMTIGTAFSDAVQGSAQPYAYGFQPRFNTELNIRPEAVMWITQATDSVVPAVYSYKRTQSVPAPNKNYVVRFRSRNLPNKTVPVAKVISCSKSGATTATIVTDIPHGLNSLDWVQIYGTSDQTNFANLAAITVIASIVNPTTFTVVWGTAVTATCWGGTVLRVNGSNTSSVTANTIRGIARNGNGYMMVGTHSTSTVLIGDTIRIHGLRDNTNDMGVDGRYKVAQINPAFWTATTVTGNPVVTGIADTSLLAVGAYITGTGVAASSYIVSIQAGIGFTLNVNITTGAVGTILTQVGLIVEAEGAALQPVPSGAICGGAIFKESDLRLNFVKVFDYERTPVEVVSGHTNTDQFNSVGVSIQNGAYVTIGAVSTVSTVTTVSTLTTMNQVAGVAANSFIYDQMHLAWSNTVRKGIV